jgi:cytochrome c-type biogenesis protein CcmH/NrfF
MHRSKLNSQGQTPFSRRKTFLQAGLQSARKWLSVPPTAVLLLALLSTGHIFAQSEAQIESDQVKRVGSKINCQCGGCKDDANCMMSGGQCHFCKPARTQIFQMQQEGQSDEAIVASFIKQYGQKIFRPDPNSWFWLVPYLGLAAGGVLIVLVLARMRNSAHKLQPAAGPPLQDDAAFTRYRDAIEKDTDRLE